jgi:signal transduction histidine kinase
MTLSQFFKPDEFTRLKQELASESFGGRNRLFLYETTLIGESERRIPVQLSAVALAEGDQIDGRVCFFRDLREIRALEREVEDQARILHQDKMMSMGKLAASVVHEINNPLSGVLNYIRLMTRILRRGPLPDDRREKFMQYLDLVENETDRCSHIVSSLLAFSRKSPPSFGPVDVDELLQRCIALSQHKLKLQNIELLSQLEDGLPDIEGDFNQLQQCVINLVFNAIDAMPEGGTLTLRSRYERMKHMVLIAVTDTGHGIAKEDLPHIFEPFFTTKKEGYGVGLGLSTIFGIIQRHNGAVDVQSRLGEGTTFTLQLPAKNGALPAKPHEGVGA